MSGRPRLKFLQIDILIAIAALDIVINKAPHNDKFEYGLARKVMFKYERAVEKSFIRLSMVESRITLQAIRLALRAIGTIEMEAQAIPTLDRLERYVNDI